MELKLKNNSNLKLSPYTELEYIESTGTQYIDTGINVTNLNYIFKIGISNLADSTAFGVGESGRAVACAQIFFVTNNVRINWGNWTSYGEVIGTFNENQVITLEIKPGTNVTLNGVGTSYTANTPSFSTGKNATFSLFATVAAGSTPASNTVTPKSMRIHNFTVLYNGVKIIDLLPVKDSNGVVCMYDTVSQTFFYNQGTGDFVAGPKVSSGSVDGMHPALFKASSLYHENCPNINGWSLLNAIYNWNINNQTEIKYLYYKNSATWQTIITQHPEFETYAETNHQFLISICEQDNPINAANQFAANIEQYPALAPIIVENPALAPIIVENPEVIHSLVDTGKETSLISSGTQYIDTGFIPTEKTKVECSFELYSARNALIFAAGNAWNNRAFGFGMATTYFYLTFNNQETRFNNTILKQTIEVGYGVQSADSFTSTHSLTLFAFNYNTFIIDDGSIRLYNFKIQQNNEDALWLAPIENNGNPCMIDLLTGTKYLNQGTGSFTYTLEDKQ